MNNQKDLKEYDMINSSNHYYLAELLYILETFAKLKEEATNEKNVSFHGNFIKT